MFIRMRISPHPPVSMPAPIPKYLKEISILFMSPIIIKVERVCHPSFIVFSVVYHYNVMWHYLPCWLIPLFKSRIRFGIYTIRIFKNYAQCRLNIGQIDNYPTEKKCIYWEMEKNEVHQIEEFNSATLFHIIEQRFVNK